MPSVRVCEFSPLDLVVVAPVGFIFHASVHASMFVVASYAFPDTFRTFKKTVLKEHFDTKEEELADAARVAAEREVPEIEKLATIKSTRR
jgi:hypothetical protein